MKKYRLDRPGRPKTGRLKQITFYESENVFTETVVYLYEIKDTVDGLYLSPENLMGIA